VLGDPSAKHHQSLPVSLPRADLRNIGREGVWRHYPNEGDRPRRAYGAYEQCHGSIGFHDMALFRRRLPWRLTTTV
jgi:hypothetical protein